MHFANPASSPGLIGAKAYANPPFVSGVEGLRLPEGWLCMWNRILPIFDWLKEYMDPSKSPVALKDVER